MHSTEELIHKLRERAAFERDRAARYRVNTFDDACDALILEEAATELERLYRAMPLDRT